MTTRRAPRVTWPQALGWRLRQHLLEPVGGGSVVDVVRRLGAVPAADPVATELGLRVRCGRSRAGDVERALAAGRLIRTFAFRGAVHVMTPTEGADILALRAAGRMWERRGWREFYGLQPADWPPLLDAVVAALADGPLTREELASAVTAGRGFAHLRPAFVEPSYTFIKALAWQGALTLGPPRDGRATFQRLAGTPHWPGLPDLDEAGPRAVSAYLQAYGPASPAHVHYWLGNGLGAGRARIDRWLAGLGDRLARVEVEGEPHLVRAADVDAVAGARASRVVRLLPGHDQWVLGPGTADPHVVPPAQRAVVTRGADLTVVGGVVAGTWSIRHDAVAVDWFDGGRRTPDGLEAEVARLAALLDRPLRPA